MHKRILDDFFNTGVFLISECNLAGLPMLKILTEKLSDFSQIKNFAKISLQPSLFRNL